MVSAAVSAARAPGRRPAGPSVGGWAGKLGHRRGGQCGPCSRRKSLLTRRGGRGPGGAWDPSLSSSPQAPCPGPLEAEGSGGAQESGPTVRPDRSWLRAAEGAAELLGGEGAWWSPCGGAVGANERAVAGPAGCGVPRGPHPDSSSNKLGSWANP